MSAVVLTLSQHHAQALEFKRRSKNDCEVSIVFAAPVVRCVDGLRRMYFMISIIELPKQVGLAYGKPTSRDST